MPDPLPLFRTPAGRARYVAAYEAALSLWPVPHESLRVATPFGSTHVVASGPPDAPPLVLLPMAATSATIWFANVSALSRAHRVYAADTLGDLGQSVAARPHRTRAAAADWLLGLLDALAVESAPIVGASYGGWLALNLALHAPERVERLALLAPAGSFAPLSLRFVAAMAPALLAPSRRTVGKAAHALAARDFRIPEPLIDQLTAGFQNLRLRSWLGMALPVRFPARELRQLNLPVLLLVGQHEIIYRPRAVLRRAARLLPDLDAELIPHAGHGLGLEQPGLVNRRLLDFLA